MRRAGRRRRGWGAGVLGIALALALGVGVGACTPVGWPATPTPPEREPRVLAPPPRDAAARPAPAPVPVPHREVRALWVVRTTLASPDRIRAMVREAEAGGFNTLLVQVRGRGDAYYDSRVEPRADALSDTPRDFDPLALVLEEAHLRGMQVHAWVNTHLVGGLGDLPADETHLVRSAPHLLAVPRELARSLHPRDPRRPAYARQLLSWTRDRRGRVEGLFASPAHPEVHDRMLRIWTDLVERYPVDGLHLDYIRYPSRDFDYSRGALAAFRAWAAPRVGPDRTAALDRAARADPLAWPDAVPELWDTFRRERITGLVARLHREVKSRHPGLVISAAVFADAVDAREHRFQDWPAWLERGLVDVVAPMAYTPDDARFREQVAAAVRAAGDPRRVWAGIGVYRTTFDGTVSKIGIAREVGAGGVALFSYDWAASEGEERGGVPFLQRVGRRAFGR